MAKTFLTAEWRWLAMLNWEVDPDLLRPLVPRGTELDAWSGKTLVSLVGFLFLRTRVLGVPIPFHRSFEEANLRFYVRRVERGEVRRGVVFVKEVVPRFAIAAVARWVYNESYVCLPMRHARDATSIEYGWGDCSVRARFDGEPSLPSPGSEEEFVTEHYWGYAKQRDGSTVEYRVEHPQWRIWRASEPRAAGSFAQLYGEKLGAALARPPSSAFVAEGSEVVVRRGRPIA